MATDPINSGLMSINSGKTDVIWCQATNKIENARLISQFDCSALFIIVVRCCSSGICNIFTDHYSFLGVGAGSRAVTM